MKILKIQHLLYALTTLMVACGASDELKNADKELQLALLSAEDHSTKEVSEEDLNQVGCKFVEGNIMVELQCQKANSFVEKTNQKITQKNYVNSATKRLGEAFSSHLKYTKIIIENKRLSILLPSQIPMIILFSSKSPEKYLAKEAMVKGVEQYYTYSFLMSMMWLHDVDVHIAKDGIITIGDNTQNLDLSQKAIDKAIEYLTIMKIFEKKGLEIKSPYARSTMTEVARILEELK